MPSTTKFGVRIEVAVNELLEFEDGTVGLALNLDEESIGAVVLGDADGVEEGQTVKATGRSLSVPVGDATLGRIFNVTRERVRQIEAKAIRKLRHPSRSRPLREYIE